MATYALHTRRPLAALGKLTLVALWINVFAYGIEMVLIGQPDLEIGIVTLVLLVVSGLVATGWRWSPALAALIVSVSFLGGLPFKLYHLSHPNTFGFFAITVVNLACDLAIVAGGIGATIQNYRGNRGTPDWLSGLVASLLGMTSGALLIGGLVATAGPLDMPTTKGEGPQAVRMAPSAFQPSLIRVPQGELLTLQNAFAVPHVVANGAWENDRAQPSREPGAPLVNDRQVNDAGEILQIGPFSTPGRYRFYCPLHPGMNLTVVVEQ